MEMRKKNTGEGLCSNACPGHGRRRRRPCSSVWDAPVSCASGKRKHGPAYARAPQRSTLKEHVPRPGRILFAAAEEWERSPVRPWASAKYFTLLKWFKISGPNTPPFQYVIPNWDYILFGSAHVFCMTKFLAQTMISKVSKPNIQKPIEKRIACRFLRFQYFLGYT